MNPAKKWCDHNQKWTPRSKFLVGFEWNRDPMPNKKHEPWYVRMPQSAMDGLIDESMNAIEFYAKFE